MASMDKKNLEVTKTAQESGDSKGLRIPKEIARKHGIVEGAKIIVQDDDDNILLKAAEEVYTLEELLAQCKPDGRHEEIDWGKPVGKEIW